MREKVQKLLIAVMINVATFYPAFVGAQQTVVDQIIIVNGGGWESMPPFSDYVTVAAYDPVSKNYNVFDTIYNQSAQSVTIDGNFAYVAAEDSLVMYDIDNYTRVAAIKLPGLQKMAVYDSLLLVSRGYGAFDDYVVVYNKNTLDSIKVFSSVSDQCNEIIIVNDTAYVGVPGGYGSSSGKIAVIDLNSLDFVREENLDTLGKEIGSLCTDGNKIYTVNSIGWMENGVVSHYDVALAMVDTFVQVGTPASKGVMLKDGLLYANYGQGLGTYNINTLQIQDTAIIPLSYTGSAFDTINSLFYLSTTDYFSYGKTYVYDFTGTVVDSFDVGISPEAIAVSYKTTVGIIDLDFIKTVNVFPIPAKDEIIITANGNLNYFNILITDIAGRAVLRQENLAGGNALKINIAELLNGHYLITVSNTDFSVTKKFIKN
ncbi:MAG: T9SS type A sorting domain-containing protein [Bacteroidota bacterium]